MGEKGTTLGTTSARSSMTMRPIGLPPAVMSKNTLGLAMFLWVCMWADGRVFMSFRQHDHKCCEAWCTASPKTILRRDCCDSDRHRKKQQEDHREQGIAQDTVWGEPWGAQQGSGMGWEDL